MVFSVVRAGMGPGFLLAPGNAEAASEHALLLIPHLRLLARQRARLAVRIQALLCINSRPVTQQTPTGTSVAT